MIFGCLLTLVFMGLLGYSFYNGDALRVSLFSHITVVMITSLIIVNLFTKYI